MSYQQPAGAVSSPSDVGGRHVGVATTGPTGASTGSLTSSSRTGAAVKHVDAAAGSAGGGRHLGSAHSSSGGGGGGGGAAAATYGHHPPRHAPQRHDPLAHAPPAQQQRQRPHQQQQQLLLPPQLLPSTLPRTTGIAVASSLGSSGQHASLPMPVAVGPSGATIAVAGAAGGGPGSVSSSQAQWRGASGGAGSGDRRRRSGSGRSGGGGGGRRHGAQAQRQQQQRPQRGDAAAAGSPLLDDLTATATPTTASAAPETAAGLVASPPSLLPDRHGAPSPSASTAGPAAAPASSVVPGHGSQPPRRGGGGGGGGSGRGDGGAAATTAAAAGAGAPPPPPLPLSASSGPVAAASAAAPPQKSQRSSGGAAAGVRLVRPNGEERPTVALSQNIMSVYEAINTLFYQKCALLEAPVKDAARKYDDAAGHYIPRVGEEIADRYVVTCELGKGSFGTVLECVDHKYNEKIAMKVIRSGAYFENQAWFEAQVVAHLNNDPALQHLVVQLRKVFMWRGHMVLIFEQLSLSLYNLITCTKYNGVSLDLTRKFAYQMIKVLLVLEQHQPPIIHCDLKPENVLLRDQSRSEVRVIDFGSACYQQQPEWTLPPAQVQLPASSPSSSPGPPWDKASCSTSGNSGGGDSGVPRSSPQGQQQQQQQQRAPAADAPASHVRDPAADEGSSGGAGHDDDDAAKGNIIMPKYIQSRYYRSPEVILELGYTTAIDRWSLGCFLVEMHTGVPLFPGKNEGDMIAYFTSILGPLPDYMIAASPKRTQLYYTCEAEPAGEDHQSGGSSGGAVDAPPALTPTTCAPGHAAGSPFFLRAPRPEGEGAAAAAAAALAAAAAEVAAPTAGGSGGGGGAATPSSLEEILGVRKGGPRGCRAGQPGHDEATYELFCDFIRALLQYDPRKRVSCHHAIQHPFLEPIRALKSRPAAAPTSDGDREGAAGTPPPLPPAPHPP
ncbi:protein kinase [Novymonas esmeraldas]|uniref:Protein kinase n=1 Tax=Novymonas esmeraldas TaxID=1808958 RepID=A0AAW0FAL7_9TRYP